ncbi:hypothetical protein, conserved in T. vivax [Trypanosoma vivax Y486]|uniref:Uncharacterized protein n=1 Tax=Trypanosoma vivax (strain Y486) TaxID=1055687 RepID=F9WVK6_TRYVY|nr:hypothetical protein, conserved in T. vivax [Trypanosoma vivax Y486]|eukprot:CCD21614.1 hypothetical protein, conserved in T. vivax [Trypanosoma vivax Y486]
MKFTICCALATVLLLHVPRRLAASAAPANTATRTVACEVVKREASGGERYGIDGFVLQNCIWPSTGPQRDISCRNAEAPMTFKNCGNSGAVALFKGQHSSRTGSSIATDCVADHAVFRLLMEDAQSGLFDLIHVQCPLGVEHRVEEKLCGHDSEHLVHVSCRDVFDALSSLRSASAASGNSTQKAPEKPVENAASREVDVNTTGNKRETEGTEGLNKSRVNNARVKSAIVDSVKGALLNGSFLNTTLPSLDDGRVPSSSARRAAPFGAWGFYFLHVLSH